MDLTFGDILYLCACGAALVAIEVARRRYPS